MHFKGAIFDLDGTVFDSLDMWLSLYMEYFKNNSLELTEEYFAKTSHLNLRESAFLTVEMYNMDISGQQMVDSWHDYAERGYKEVKLKPHAKQYLEYLKSKGIKLGVATALDGYLMKSSLESQKLLGLFDALTSSEEVSRSKAFPDVYELAASKLGLNADECMVFEDNPTALSGAKSGGFLTCAVYEKSFVHAWDKMQSAADVSITDYAQLMTK